jgi:hypothetical protein
MGEWEKRRIGEGENIAATFITRFMIFYALHSTLSIVLSPFDNKKIKNYFGIKN